MNMIAAVDKNWAIGYRGNLLVRIPADQKWFQTVTMGKVIVAGRKTLETFPNGMPLLGRRNIILSENRGLQIRGAQVAHSLDETMELLKPFKSEDIFIVGGESIYRQFLPYCSVAHITRIDYAYEADAYFPNLELLPEWRLTADSEEQTYFDLEYTFQRFTNSLAAQPEDGKKA